MSRRGTRRRALAVAGLLLLVGCVDDDEPVSARVLVESDPAAPLVLVVSTRFLTPSDPDSPSEELVLLKADTLALTGDYDQQFDISQFHRIYVLVRNDEETPEPVRLRILVDGRQRFETTDEIADGRTVSYTFTSFSAS